MFGRLLRWIVTLAAIAGLLLLFLCEATRNADHRSARLPTRAAAAARPIGAGACGPAPAFAAAAARNGVGLVDLPQSVFGRPELGWAIYGPLAAREIGSPCPPGAEGFAAALARWQESRGLPPTGEMDTATLAALDLAWLRRRPFVAASAGGACPAPPPPTRLADARPDEGFEGKVVQLRPGALAAWRAMISAARAQAPEIAADRRLLSLVSGYRDPADDDARCAREHDCGGVTRASCSAHRTGLAMDLFLGAAPGFAPTASADADRLFESRSPAYRWLVANAGRFGFVPYPFEPWHWEWTGEPP